MAEINTWPGWECVRQLGAGAFGKVYEIQRIENGKVYKSALKVISVPQNEADIENAYSEGMDKENVFVNKNGDFKLGDFGIARVAEKTSSVISSQKGTYTYMAPEGGKVWRNTLIQKH